MLKAACVHAVGKIREGNKKFATEIVADNFIMLDKRSDQSAINFTCIYYRMKHENLEGFNSTDEPHRRR